MNELQIFNNPEFGEIRTHIEPDGTVLFCGTDIAKALGYANPRKAVRTHCKGGLKRATPSGSGIQSMIFIPEGDVYRLMYKAAEQSNNADIKAKAERFGGWIFDDVLPKINREGAYITAKADPAALRKKADELESMATINETARILLPVLEQAGMKPQFQALTMRQIYRKAGVELPMDDLRAERELYDLKAIARKAGVYSLTGKPHERAVGAIIRQVNVPDTERELVNFEKQGHMGTTYQYTSKVVDLVQEWLISNDCPATIQSDMSGKPVTYKVQYDAGRAM